MHGPQNIEIFQSKEPSLNAHLKKKRQESRCAPSMQLLIFSHNLLIDENEYKYIGMS